jgi:photosystem II stability/assembly factor-like uncharacterized protein
MVFSRSFILALLILFPGCIILAQPWLLDTTKLKTSYQSPGFKSTQEAFYNYWNSREIYKGSGYKQFKRWEFFMDERLGNSGQINSTSYWNAIHNFKLTFTKDTLQWNYIGPENTPLLINTSNKSGNGRLNCIAFHPEDDSLIYVGAPSGGLWISSDKGATWNTTTDKLSSIGISDIAVVKNDTVTEIYIATGDGDGGDTYAIGILKSLDGGINWDTTALSLEAANNIYFRRIIADPANARTMLTTSSDGIFKTTDAWASYTKVASGNFKDIELKPGNGSYVYATTFEPSGNARIFRSTDGGNTFFPLSSGLNISGRVNRIELAVSPANPEIIYALCSSALNSGFYALYRSTNSGNSWSLMYGDDRKNLLGISPTGNSAGGLGYYAIAMAVSPTNANIIMVGGINLWRSTNGGTEWTLSSAFYHDPTYEYVHADQHFITYSPHNGHLYAANDGGIYFSINNGYNWADLSNNLEILQTYRLGSSLDTVNNLITGNQDNGTLIKTNDVWKQVLLGDGMSCHIDRELNNIIYASAFNGELFRSVDTGNTFLEISPEDNLSGAWITPFEQHPYKNKLIYAAYKDVYFSADRGDTWSKISDNLSEQNLTSLVISKSNDNYIYAASKSNIYKTADAGNSWETLPTDFTESITSVCVAYNDPNKLWVSMSGYTDSVKVIYSHDGGNTWQNFSEGLPNIPVNEIIMRDRSNYELYAATDVGVFYRSPDTSLWINASLTLPNVIVNNLEINEPLNKLLVATYGRGIWEATLPEAKPIEIDFNSNITTGCHSAPININYTGVPGYDSLAWIIPEGDIIMANSNKDSIVVSFSNTGLKTIQLNVYGFDSVSSEIKNNYIDIRDSLAVSLPYDELIICNNDSLSIELEKSFNYLWSPNLFIDTNRGNHVHITASENITYQIEANHGACFSSLTLPVRFMPDDVCSATFLALDYTYYFSNICATRQPNEPVPPAGSGDNNGCISQDGWCDNQTYIENSLWFLTTVPETGHLLVRTEGIDSQIAIYLAENCSALLEGHFTLLAANDDISSHSTSSQVEIKDSLTPGDTLYIQFDGSFGGTSGNFSILVLDTAFVEPDTASIPKIDNIKLFPNPAKNTFNIQVKDQNQQALYIDIFDFTGKLIYANEFIANSDNYIIPVDTILWKGIYIVRINSEEGQQVKKLIVK